MILYCEISNALPEIFKFFISKFPLYLQSFGVIAKVGFCLIRTLISYFFLKRVFEAQLPSEDTIPLCLKEICPAVHCELLTPSRDVTDTQAHTQTDNFLTHSQLCTFGNHGWLPRDSLLRNIHFYHGNCSYGNLNNHISLQ